MLAHKFFNIDPSYPSEAITRHNSPYNVDFDFKFQLRFRWSWNLILKFCTFRFLPTWHATIMLGLEKHSAILNKTYILAFTFAYMGNVPSSAFSITLFTQ